MPISFVQSAQHVVIGGTVTNCAFSSPNTAGSFLLAWFDGHGTPLNPVPTDTQGNTWLLAAANFVFPVTSYGGALYFCQSCKAGANTVTIGGGGQSDAMSVYEFSGGKGTDGASWSPFSTSMTTALDSDLVFATYQVGLANSAPVVTVSVGWTAGETMHPNGTGPASPPIGFIYDTYQQGWLIKHPAGSVDNFTWNLGGGASTNGTLMVAFSTPHIALMGVKPSGGSASNFSLFPHS